MKVANTVWKLGNFEPTYITKGDRDSPIYYSSAQGLLFIRISLNITCHLARMPIPKCIELKTKKCRSTYNFLSIVFALDEGFAFLSSAASNWTSVHLQWASTAV